MGTLIKMVKMKVLLLLLLSVLSGCASLHSTPTKTISDKDMLAYIDDEGGINAEKACLLNQTVECRNKIVYNRLIDIDINYETYINKLFNEDKTISFLTTITTLGLNGFASLYGLKVLSMVSSTIIGAQASYSQDVLINKTVSSLQKEMTGNRALVKTRILLALKQPVTKYPFLVAKMDLLDYYNAGTILSALEGISSSTSVKADSNLKVLNQTIKSVYSETPTGDILEKYALDSNGLPIVERIQVIDKWLVDNKIANTHAATLINGNSPELEALRKQLIADLKLQ